jgi:undecaprenyl diphosphate synthase
MKRRLVLLSCVFIVSSMLWFAQKSQRSLAENYIPRESPLTHLAIIIDGNRRWARERGMETHHGHRKGMENLRTAIDFCLENSIPYVTFYTLSLENLKRSPQELNYLFDIIAKEFAAQEINKLIEQGIRVRFIGERSQFPESLRPIIEEMEQKTAGGTKLQLTLLFCYGGRQEIVSAIKKIVAEIKRGIFSEKDLTPETFEHFLWTDTLPSPELIIRTGGAQRLSNLLPYQSTYTELYFLTTYWPDITKRHLEEAIVYFKGCKRNFGS